MFWVLSWSYPSILIGTGTRVLLPSLWTLVFPKGDDKDFPFIEEQKCVECVHSKSGKSRDQVLSGPHKCIHDYGPMEEVSENSLTKTRNSQI